MAPAAIALPNVAQRLNQASPSWARASDAVTALHIDKFASVSRLVPCSETVQVAPFAAPPCVGDCVVVRVLKENPRYNQLELVNGRLARLSAGDTLLGVLGARSALRGFVGIVPTTLAPHDELSLLNMGGVIGVEVGGHHELGRASSVELLGALMREDGQAVNLRDHALPTAQALAPSAPLVVVAGTCMHAGKTQACAELIRQFTKRGRRVAATKLSGVACLRDILHMRDLGAVATSSFHDCGLPSTVGVIDLAPVAKGLINALNAHAPDLIVIELGDGILGGYNVDSVLNDREIKSAMGALVFCASDFVGAWGGVELLRRGGHVIDVITGAATDSSMGVEFIQSQLGVAAANAISGGCELHAIVAARLEARRAQA